MSLGYIDNTQHPDLHDINSFQLYNSASVAGLKGLKSTRYTLLLLRWIYTSNASNDTLLVILQLKDLAEINLTMCAFKTLANNVLKKLIDGLLDILLCL